MTRHHEDVATALALSEVERAVIQDLGDHTIATGIRAAQVLGQSMTAVALAAGLTRTRAYAILERDADTVDAIEQPMLRRLTAAALGRDGLLGLAAHADKLQVPADAMQRALARLRDLGVAEAIAQTPRAETGNEFWFDAGPAHAEWLWGQQQTLRWMRQERFSVFLAIPHDTRAQVAAAAHEITADLATVIAAGNTSTITWDELAIAIGGDDSRDALETTADVWASIWEKIGTPAPAMLVREVLPPIHQPAKTTTRNG
jgi:hypothetical protein